MTLYAARPKTLFGYDVVSRLGNGAGSHLYVVCDAQSGQLYALKHVVRNTDKDIRYIQQLQNEFDVSRQFRSPILRKCVDLKINKKLLGGPTEAALVMELVDGEALETMPLLPPDQLIDVFMQTARGLSALHRLRFVHCDLKPHNILVSPDGQVKLIDFGQCCRTGTVKERVQGTPDFIAPEQVRLKPVSAQTDVYGFGATLYWALTHQRVPTLFTSDRSDWDSLRDQDFPSPSELNPAVPEPLSKLAMWCCKISLGSRPPDIEMVLAGLEKIRETICK